MIYLDHAATSYPKPAKVIGETVRCMRLHGGNAGRGSHRLALAAAERIFACREEIASFFGSLHPENVTFTANATAAINLAVKGLLREGDHVLISDMEHNAVLRPIAKLAAEGRITYDVFPTFVQDRNRSTARICTAIARLIRPNTRILVCAHASNICSATLPLAEIGALCRRKGVRLVVDAAQSAGHLPISLEGMKIDALCVPSHKGLLGPQGCGFVLWREGVHAETLIEGGSGYQSLNAFMPESLPERHEAGTLPAPIIAGLCEGIREVRRQGLDTICAHEASLCARLSEMLTQLPRVSVYVPQYHGSVALFSVDSMPSDAVGRELDRRGICVRTGFHCAALAHRTLGTPDTGAVRVSVGMNTRQTDVDALFLALREILQ